MPNQKRPSLIKKRTTERQIVLARRSRSIKASLLQALSLDLVTLYQAEQTQDRANPVDRAAVRPTPRDLSTSSHTHNISPNIPTSVHLTEPHFFSKTENLGQAQQASERLPDSTQRNTDQSLLGVVIVRSVAFLIGSSIRYTLVLYVQPFAILLSGIVIAIIGTSVLIVIVFMPWKKKLFWNLSCLFGGLLIAVLFL